MASPEQKPRFDIDIELDRHDRSSVEPVGNLLRRKREEYGQNLHDIAQQLRIRVGYLQAIEEGRSKDLPGSTYAVGFVRTYADYLGLDSVEILRRFREEAAELSGRQQLVFPAAVAEGKFPGGAILLLSLLLVAAAYGAWSYLSDRQMNLLDMVPAVPERLSALVDDALEVERTSADAPPTVAAADQVAKADDAPAEPGRAQADTGAVASGSTAPEPVRAEAADPVEPARPTDAPAAETAESRTVPQQTAVAAAQSQQPRSVEGRDLTAPQSEEVSPPAPPTAEAPPITDTPPETSLPETSLAAIPAAPAVPPADDAGQTFGVANTGSRITLSARLESWVQVTDDSEAIVWTRVLQAGDRYRVPNRPGLSLTTGNAGGLEILVDGRPARALGPVGAVRRGVPLDPERLAAGTALSN